jgi:membrane protease YdiL (CAAX protease family)
MNDPTAALSTILLLALATGLCFLAGWAVLALRSVEPRRAVPWNGWDVLVVLGAFVLFFGTTVFTARWALGIRVGPEGNPSPRGSQAASSLGADRAAAVKKTHPAPTESEKEKTAMHPLLVALGQRHQPGTLLLCGFAAVLAAPLAEEFFFRLLLQGWLETIESCWRKRLRLLRLLPGLVPVLLVSALFAAMHFRKEEELPANVDPLLAQLVLSGLAELLTVVFAVVYLRSHRGATAADLGFVPRMLPRDLALGLAAILCSMPLLMFIQAAAGIVLKKIGADVAADPFTLFFFALVTGILYFRTHRIVPSIVMHVAFNATELAAAWYLWQMLKP